eukprot:m.338276 g.338276  ORF g.338276 m.338276 type:complete len:344 (+) comp18367_c0_seq1:212-1243(+)
MISLLLLLCVCSQLSQGELPQESCDTTIQSSEIEMKDWDSEIVKNLYNENGYVIIRQVFNANEITIMKTRFDEWYERNHEHHTTYIQGNKRIWVKTNKETQERVVRGMQWPSYEDEVLDSIRTDWRLSLLVQTLIGPNVSQVINQMHWKQPNSGTTWRYHQDVRSRKPDSAFRKLAESYVATGIAIEKHTAKTGAMQVVPKSHKLGDLDLETLAQEMDARGTSPTEEEQASLLTSVGISPSELKVLQLNPGDLVAWHPFVIHGGGHNTDNTGNLRSFYINGYVTKENCDRGHVVWINNVSQPLGEPVLVQLENFKETLKSGMYVEEESKLTDREIEKLSTARD